MQNNIIFTIGHSTHQHDYFLELLKKYCINCLIDVRSIPASKYNPQFNKDVLCDFLEGHEIMYLSFAKEFGARRTENTLLDENGYVDFDKVRRTESYKQKINKLKELNENECTIVLMCSEAEPFDCHRFSMISYSLIKEGYEVRHILKDKTFITNEELEKKLLKTYSKKTNPTVFNPEIYDKDELDLAYKLRNKDVAFSPFAMEKEEKL